MKHFQVLCRSCDVASVWIPQIPRSVFSQEIFLLQSRHDEEEKWQRELQIQAQAHACQKRDSGFLVPIFSWSGLVLRNFLIFTSRCLANDNRCQLASFLALCLCVDLRPGHLSACRRLQEHQKKVSHMHDLESMHAWRDRQDMFLPGTSGTPRLVAASVVSLPLICLAGLAFA